MGGPKLNFCGGRIDSPDGSDSLILGPSPEQSKLYPCSLNGNCSLPYGPTTVGLIYVNPGGHMSNGDPAGLIPDIRRTFHNMGMSDYDLVALIGGGHSMGKAHGGCPNGAGPGPDVDPINPWPGNCPSTFTSGFDFFFFFEKLKKGFIRRKSKLIVD